MTKASSFSGTLLGVVCLSAAQVTGQELRARDDAGVAERLLDVFPELRSSAPPRFSVPVSVVNHWVASKDADPGQRLSDAPYGMLLRSWEAHVSADDNGSDVRLIMEVHVFRASKESPERVLLFPEDTVYESIQLNGADVVPYRDAGQSWLSIEEPGRYQIDVTLGVKVTASAERRSLRLSPGDYVVSSLHFSSDQALEVSASGASRRLRGDRSSGTRGVLALGRDRAVEVSWIPVQPSVQRKGTLTVDPTVAWQVQDRILSAQARLMIGVQGGARDRATLRLPVGADNVSVSGGEVRDSRQDGRELTVFFAGPVSGRTEVSLTFDVPKTGGSTVRLPDVVPVDGRLGSEGWVVVTDDAIGQLFEHARKGLRAVSDVELPAEASGLAVGEPVLMYQRTSRTAGLTLDHVTMTPFTLVDTIADRADVTVMTRRSGAEMTRIRYMIRNNKSQFLRMTLPESAQLLSVTVDGRSRPVSKDGAVTLVPLVRSIQTLGGLVSFPVEIAYLNQGEAYSESAKRRVDLPELAGVPVARMTVRAWCPEELDLDSVGGVLKRVEHFSGGGESFVLSSSRKKAAGSRRSLQSRSV